MFRRSRDGASSSAIGLSVAAATFGIAFVTANMLVQEPATSDSRSIELDTASSTALDVIVGQAGRSAGSSGWLADPDVMTRFGLAQEGAENFLDYRKIKAMRNATTAALPNDAPDYTEVKAALGIGRDFHLRTYPVIPDTDDPRWSKDPRGRLGYVAHYDAPRGYAALTVYANTTTSLNASVAIRNDGAAPHVFVATIGVGQLATDTVIKSAQRHTRLLSPGEVQTIFAEFPPMAYSPSITGVKVELADAYGETTVAPFWTSATAPSGTNVPFAPLIAAGDLYYETTETVKFQADHFEGDGTRINSAQSGVFRLIRPNGSVVVNTTVTLPKNGVYTYSCTNCTTPGTYTGILWDSAMTRKAQDVVHVSATGLFEERDAIGLLATREIGILADLMSNFNTGEFDATTNPQGDVFADSSHIRDLDDVIDRYSTLVVGSEVKQNSLNSGQTKWAIADWVQAGGNLIVLGTLDSQSHWLEPVYHAAQTTANGGISAPDPTHPILKAPNEMDYQRYNDNGRAWKVKNDQPFTHVLSRGQSGDSREDTLAISHPGAYNDGTVVLTSYMAGALTTPQDDAEAKRFLHNLLSQSYTMLFLDYGPPVPSGVTVGSAQRLAAVPHPNVPNAVVEVRIVMYTW